MLATDFVASVPLVLAQQIRVKFNISGFVDTMDITKGSSDAEVGRDLTQRIVDVIDVLWLGVKARVVNASVVDAVFFTACDADLHLEPEPKGRHALEILDTNRNVLFFRLLGQVKHVGGEKRFLVFLEKFLVCSEHSVEPGKEFLCAMVTVENYRARETVGGHSAPDQNPTKLTRHILWRQREREEQQQQHRR